MANEYTYTKQTPNSTNIRQVYYDLPTQRLFIDFKSGGKAAYIGVPPETVDEMLESDSVGRYYNRKIREKFKGVGSGDGTFIRRMPASTHPYTPVPEQPKPQATNATNANGLQSTGSITPYPKRRDYIVRGYVLVEETYSAMSPEEAVEQIKKDYEGEVVIKEVAISFES